MTPDEKLEHMLSTQSRAERRRTIATWGRGPRQDNRAKKPKMLTLKQKRQAAKREGR